MTVATRKPAERLIPAADIFRERCEARAILVNACIYDLQDAVDGLQADAERTGLVDEIGQDAVQKMMAQAFAILPKFSLHRENYPYVGIIPKPRGAATSTLRTADYLVQQKGSCAPQGVAGQTHARRAHCHHQTYSRSEAMNEVPPWVEDVFASFNDEPQKKESHGANGRGAGNAHRFNGPTLVSRRAANITPEKVDWLWVGRIARGKHTCIAGEPGTGKSQLSIIITAAITTSGGWPCDEGWAPLGNVIILSAEDGASDTIVPRLMAAGADRDRVHIVSAVRNSNGKGQRTFNLQTDIELLERKISEIGDVALVIVDPVSSYLGKTDSHKNSEVRGVLEPLSDMAERTRVAVLTVTHFNKTGANGTTKALHRFIGSIAFTGAPRCAFAVIEDPEDADHRLFLHAKNNLAAPPQGLGFRLQQTLVAEGILGSQVIWDSEPVTITANQALAAEAAGSDQRGAEAEAQEFLRNLLAGGPVAQKQVKEDAEGAGLAWATVRRAKDRLGVIAKRETDAGFASGAGRWVWCLKVLNTHLRCSSPDMSTLSTDEHLKGGDSDAGEDLGIPEFLRR